MAAFPFATAERFSSLMDNPEMARLWLAGLGVRDAERGFRDLRDLAARGLPLRLVARLAEQLDSALPRCPDPGMALTNLERFVAASPTPEATLEALATNAPIGRDRRPALQHQPVLQRADDPRPPPARLAPRRGRPPRPRDPDRRPLGSTSTEAPSEEARRLALRWFRLREILRIGYNDIVRDLPLELITLDLSHLADACVEVAYRLARQHAEERHGKPSGSDGRARAVRRAGARASSAARS